MGERRRCDSARLRHRNHAPHVNFSRDSPILDWNRARAASAPWLAVKKLWDLSTLSRAGFTDDDKRITPP